MNRACTKTSYSSKLLWAGLYKHVFEKLRKKAKQTYYQPLLEDCQNDIKSAWQIMKEITKRIQKRICHKVFRSIIR